MLNTLLECILFFVVFIIAGILFICIVPLLLLGIMMIIPRSILIPIINEKVPKIKHTNPVHQTKENLQELLDHCKIKKELLPEYFNISFSRKTVSAILSFPKLMCMLLSLSC